MLYECDLLFDDKRPLRTLEKLVDHVFSTRIFGLPSHALVSIASGKADLYLIFMCEPGDIAAGILIVDEAGGRVTDFYGGS